MDFHHPEETADCTVHNGSSQRFAENCEFLVSGRNAFLDASMELPNRLSRARLTGERCSQNGVSILDGKLRYQC